MLGSVWKERGIESCLLAPESSTLASTQPDPAATSSQNTEISNQSKTRICHFIRTSGRSTIIPSMPRTNSGPAKSRMQTQLQAHIRVQNSLLSKDTSEECLVVSNLSTNNSQLVQRILLPRKMKKIKYLVQLLCRPYPKRRMTPKLSIRNEDFYIFIVRGL